MALYFADYLIQPDLYSLMEETVKEDISADELKTLREIRQRHDNAEKFEEKIIDRNEYVLVNIMRLKVYRSQ
jgi:hypothetical protein